MTRVITGDCLDVIGVNTYDPIAKYDDYPTKDTIRNAWWWIVYKARTLAVRFDRHVMITEVGYPSVAHAHVGPWDFRSDKPVDLALQDHLLKGAFGVLRHWSDGDAVFFYLYGENLAQKPVGGPLDRTYAVWDKPAEATLRTYFRERIWEGHIPPRPQDLHEAMVQSLAMASYGMALDHRIISVVQLGDDPQLQPVAEVPATATAAGLFGDWSEIRLLMIRGSASSRLLGRAVVL